MPGLLISVRSGDEARRALAGGADLIDVKEPASGALGAAAPAVWRAVQLVVGNAVPLSVACGELRDLPPTLTVPPLAGLTYAKLGLAGCRDWPDWPRRAAAWCGRLPPRVRPVAVVYADAAAAAAPAPELVVAWAVQQRCAAVLVDTCGKGQGDLLAHLPWPDLLRLAESIHACGLQLVLGGSLGLQSIPGVLPARPDYIAVRGAACGGPRTGDVETERVRALAALVKPPRQASRDFAAELPPLLDAGRREFDTWR